ncbi:MAG: hypothetical protein AB1439_12800, partial [candidate division FCPU426 bacterium]
RTVVTTDNGVVAVFGTKGVRVRQAGDRVVVEPEQPRPLAGRGEAGFATLGFMSTLGLSVAGLGAMIAGAYLAMTLAGAAAVGGAVLMFAGMLALAGTLTVALMQRRNALAPGMPRLAAVRAIAENAASVMSGITVLSFVTTMVYWGLAFMAGYDANVSSTDPVMVYGDVVTTIFFGTVMLLMAVAATLGITSLAQRVRAWLNRNVAQVVAWTKNRPLAFGTSGLRGLVTDMTDAEVYINTKGYVEYLIATGQIKRGDRIVVGGDLRSSTDRIMEAVAQGIRDAGCEVENVGKVPSPAVMYYAMQRGLASVMVTGSHIPDDRNGIKFNKPQGEVLKADETGILAAVAKARSEEVTRSADESLFAENGMFKGGKAVALPAGTNAAEEEFVARYLDVLPKDALAGKKIVVEQHSAVGRDMLVRILKGMGADVVAVQRSEKFVPKDTENVTQETRENFWALAQDHRPFAIVSTDGDSDRPFVVDENGRFNRGDELGIVVAKYLGADFAAVPISANDSVATELGRAGIKLQQTQIGSPYVIAEMDAAVKVMKASAEKQYKGASPVVVSWEVNGGFLTATEVELFGKKLAALPTRDAILPIVVALLSGAKAGSVSADFAALPQRSTQAGLLDNFPVAASQLLLRNLKPSDPYVRQVMFRDGTVYVEMFDGEVKELLPGAALRVELEGKKAELEQYFTAADGFAGVVSVNFVDGVRVRFANNDVAHVRPSGNAPQLRIYSNANTQARADEIVNRGIAEGGILRQMEAGLKAAPAAEAAVPAAAAAVRPTWGKILKENLTLLPVIGLGLAIFYWASPEYLVEGVAAIGGMYAVTFAALHGKTVLVYDRKEQKYREVPRTRRHIIQQSILALGMATLALGGLVLGGMLLPGVGAVVGALAGSVLALFLHAGWNFRLMRWWPDIAAGTLRPYWDPTKTYLNPAVYGREMGSIQHVTMSMMDRVGEMAEEAAEEAKLHRARIFARFLVAGLLDAHLAAGEQITEKTLFAAIESETRQMDLSSLIPENHYGEVAKLLISNKAAKTGMAGFERKTLPDQTVIYTSKRQAAPQTMPGKLNQVLDTETRRTGWQKHYQALAQALPGMDAKNLESLRDEFALALANREMTIRDEALAYLSSLFALAGDRRQELVNLFRGLVETRALSEDELKAALAVEQIPRNRHVLLETYREVRDTASAVMRQTNLLGSLSSASYSNPEGYTVINEEGVLDGLDIVFIPMFILSRTGKFVRMASQIYEKMKQGQAVTEYSVSEELKKSSDYVETVLEYLLQSKAKAKGFLGIVKSSDEAGRVVYSYSEAQAAKDRGETTTARGGQAGFIQISAARLLAILSALGIGGYTLWATGLLTGTILLIGGALVVTVIALRIVMRVVSAKDQKTRNSILIVGLLMLALPALVINSLQRDATDDMVIKCYQVMYEREKQFLADVQRYAETSETGAKTSAEAYYAQQDVPGKMDMVDDLSFLAQTTSKTQQAWFAGMVIQAWEKAADLKGRYFIKNEKILTAFRASMSMDRRTQLAVLANLERLAAEIDVKIISMGEINGVLRADLEWLAAMANDPEVRRSAARVLKIHDNRLETPPYRERGSEAEFRTNVEQFVQNGAANARIQAEMFLSQQRLSNKIDLLDDLLFIARTSAGRRQTWVTGMIEQIWEEIGNSQGKFLTEGDLFLRVFRTSLEIGGKIRQTMLKSLERIAAEMETKLLPMGEINGVLRPDLERLAATSSDSEIKRAIGRIIEVHDRRLQTARRGQAGFATVETASVIAGLVTAAIGISMIFTAGTVTLLSGVLIGVGAAVLAVVVAVSIWQNRDTVQATVDGKRVRIRIAMGQPEPVQGQAMSQFVKKQRPFTLSLAGRTLQGSLLEVEGKTYFQLGSRWVTVDGVNHERLPLENLLDSEVLLGNPGLRAFLGVKDVTAGQVIKQVPQGLRIITELPGVAEVAYTPEQIQTALEAIAQTNLLTLATAGSLSEEQFTAYLDALAILASKQALNYDTFTTAMERVKMFLQMAPYLPTMAVSRDLRRQAQQLLIYFTKLKMGYPELLMDFFARPQARSQIRTEVNNRGTVVSSDGQLAEGDLVSANFLEVTQKPDLSRQFLAQGVQVTEHQAVSEIGIAGQGSRILEDFFQENKMITPVFKLLPEKVEAFKAYWESRGAGTYELAQIGGYHYVGLTIPLLASRAPGAVWIGGMPTVTAIERMLGSGKDILTQVVVHFVDEAGHFVESVVDVGGHGFLVRAIVSNAERLASIIEQGKIWDHIQGDDLGDPFTTSAMSYLIRTGQSPFVPLVTPQEVVFYNRLDDIKREWEANRVVHINGKRVIKVGEGRVFFADSTVLELAPEERALEAGRDAAMELVQRASAEKDKTAQRDLIFEAIRAFQTQVEDRVQGLQIEFEDKKQSLFHYSQKAGGHLLEVAGGARFVEKSNYTKQVPFTNSRGETLTVPQNVAMVILQRDFNANHLGRDPIMDAVNRDREIKQAYHAWLQFAQTHQDDPQAVLERRVQLERQVAGRIRAIGQAEWIYRDELVGRFMMAILPITCETKALGIKINLMVQDVTSFEAMLALTNISANDLNLDLINRILEASSQKGTFAEKDEVKNQLLREMDINLAPVPELAQVPRFKPIMIGMRDFTQAKNDFDQVVDRLNPVVGGYFAPGQTKLQHQALTGISWVRSALANGLLTAKAAAHFEAVCLDIVEHGAALPKTASVVEKSEYSDKIRLFNTIRIILHSGDFARLYQWSQSVEGSSETVPVGSMLIMAAAQPKKYEAEEAPAAGPQTAAEAVKQGNFASRRMLAIISVGATLAIAVGAALLLGNTETFSTENLIGFWRLIEPYALSALTGGAIAGITDAIGQKISDRPEYKLKQSVMATLIGLTFGIQTQLIFNFIDWAAPAAGWGASGLAQALGWTEALQGMDWAVKWVRTVLGAGTVVMMFEYWIITTFFAKSLKSFSFKNESKKFMDFFIAKAPIAIAYNFVLQNVIPMSMAVGMLILPIRSIAQILIDAVFQVLQAWAFNQSHPLRFYIGRALTRLLGRTPAEPETPGTEGAIRFRNLTSGHYDALVAEAKRKKEKVDKQVFMQAAKKAATNDLGWQVRQMKDPAEFAQLMEAFDQALAAGEFVSEGEAMAVLASLMASAYQNPALQFVDIIQDLTLEHASTDGVKREQMLASAALIARATVDEIQAQALASASETEAVNAIQILAEPALNLFAYDAAKTSLAADMARKLQVTRFYKTLEEKQKQGHQEAVAFMREHLTDTDLFDQKNLAELNGQRVMSALLYHAAEGTVGFDAIAGAARSASSSYWFKAAAKNADSMLRLLQVTEPTTIYITFAVYGEQMRLFNEDFLRMKITQVQELLQRNPNLRVEFVISDDEFETVRPKSDQGIEIHSGEMMQVFLEALFGQSGRATGDRFGSWSLEADLQLRFKVVRVQDAIRREAAQPGSAPVLAEYANESLSRKGGSIQYMLWMGEQLAAETPGRKSYVSYTDADISTDLMQIGLLVDPIRRGAHAAVGTSEASDSVVASKSTGRKIKSLVYNLLANGLLRLSRSTIPIVGRITDTQRGFKMFTPDVLRRMQSTFKQHPQQMAIDTALLTQLKLLGETIVEAPIAWLASEAESTVRPQDNSEMLFRVFRQRRDYILGYPGATRDGLLRGLVDRIWVGLGGLLLRALVAMINADREVHGAAIDAFKETVTKLEAVATGKSEAQVAEEMAAFYKREGIRMDTVDQYMEDFQAKEPLRLAESDPAAAEALGAQIAALPLKRFAVSTVGKNLARMKYFFREGKYKLPVAEILQQNRMRPEAGRRGEAGFATLGFMSTLGLSVAGLGAMIAGAYLAMTLAGAAAVGGAVLMFAGMLALAGTLTVALMQRRNALAPGMPRLAAVRAIAENAASVMSGITVLSFVTTMVYWGLAFMAGYDANVSSTDPVMVYGDVVTTIFFGTVMLLMAVAATLGITSLAQRVRAWLNRNVAQVVAWTKNRPLAFGTSGLRGLVTDMTDAEVYINTKGYVEYLIATGQIKRGDRIVVGGDLRSSTDRIMEAVAQGIRDAGCEVENVGKVPSPAVMYYAMQRGLASVMVTGSHIPDDRNGIKFNKPQGEVLKADETGILAAVAKARSEEVTRSADESLFAENGMFKGGKAVALPAGTNAAEEEFVARYLDVLPKDALAGKKIVVEQHSAVGRDMLVRILKGMGADVVAVQRSEKFVPKDTENVTQETRENFWALAQDHRPFAIVSTDGDSDRPFVVDENGRFNRGDELGIVVAKYLGADFAAVPISANDSVATELGRAGIKLQQTQIGSPYVIAEMDAAVKVMKASAEKQYKGASPVVVSWEVNGGFLTATEVELFGKKLAALPTRDAILPIVVALLSGAKAGSVSADFAALPQRSTQAGLLDNFPVAASQLLLRNLKPSDPYVRQVMFRDGTVYVEMFDGEVKELLPGAALRVELEGKKAELEQYFTAADGFAGVVSVNFVDGVRVRFANNDVAHVRPSGNAPQLRIYSNANTQARADEIVNRGIAEGGILRQMEAGLKAAPAAEAAVPAAAAAVRPTWGKIAKEHLGMLPVIGLGLALFFSISPENLAAGLALLGGAYVASFSALHGKTALIYDRNIQTYREVPRTMRHIIQQSILALGMVALVLGGLVLGGVVLPGLGAVLGAVAGAVLAFALHAFWNFRLVNWLPGLAAGMGMMRGYMDPSFGKLGSPQNVAIHMLLGSLTHLAQEQIEQDEEAAGRYILARLLDAHMEAGREVTEEELTRIIRSEISQMGLFLVVPWHSFYKITAYLVSEKAIADGMAGFARRKLPDNSVVYASKRQTTPQTTLGKLNQVLDTAKRKAGWQEYYRTLAETLPRMDEKGMESLRDEFVQALANRELFIRSEAIAYLASLFSLAGDRKQELARVFRGLVEQQVISDDEMKAALAVEQVARNKYILMETYREVSGIATAALRQANLLAALASVPYQKTNEWDKTRDASFFLDMAPEFVPAFLLTRTSGFIQTARQVYEKMKQGQVVTIYTLAVDLKKPSKYIREIIGYLLQPKGKANGYHGIVRGIDEVGRIVYSYSEAQAAKDRGETTATRRGEAGFISAELAAVLGGASLIVAGVALALTGAISIPVAAVVVTLGVVIGTVVFMTRRMKAVLLAGLLVAVLFTGLGRLAMRQPVVDYTPQERAALAAGNYQQLSDSALAKFMLGRSSASTVAFGFVGERVHGQPLNWMIHTYLDYYKYFTGSRNMEVFASPEQLDMIAKGELPEPAGYHHAWGDPVVESIDRVLGMKHPGRVSYNIHWPNWDDYFSMKQGGPGVADSRDFLAFHTDRALQADVREEELALLDRASEANVVILMETTIGWRSEQLLDETGRSRADYMRNLIAHVRKLQDAWLARHPGKTAAQAPIGITLNPWHLAMDVYGPEIQQWIAEGLTESEIRGRLLPLLTDFYRQMNGMVQRFYFGNSRLDDMKLPVELQRGRVIDPYGLVPEIEIFRLVMADNPGIVNRTVLEASPQAAVQAIQSDTALGEQRAASTGTVMLMGAIALAFAAMYLAFAVGATGLAAGLLAVAGLVLLGRHLTRQAQLKVRYPKTDEEGPLSASDREMLRTVFQRGGISMSPTMILHSVQNTTILRLARWLTPAFLRSYLWVASRYLGLKRAEIYDDGNQPEVALRLARRGKLEIQTLHGVSYDTHIELLYPLINRKFEKGEEAKMIIHTELLGPFLEIFAREEGLTGKSRMELLMAVAERAVANNISLLIEPVFELTQGRDLGMFQASVAEVRAWRDAWAAKHPGTTVPIQIVFDTWHWIVEGHPELSRQFMQAKTAAERDQLRAEILARVLEGYDSMQDIIGWLHITNTDPRFRSEIASHGAALFGNDTPMPNLAYLRHVQATRPDLLSKVTFELGPLYYVRSLFGHEAAVRETGRRPADARLDDRGYARSRVTLWSALAGFGLVLAGVIGTVVTGGLGVAAVTVIIAGAALISLPALLSYLNRPHPFRALWGYIAAGVAAVGAIGLFGISVSLGLGAENTALSLLGMTLSALSGGYLAVGALGFLNTGRFVRDAMLEAQLQVYWAGAGKTDHPSFDALRLDGPAYRAWVNAIPGAAMAELQRQARWDAIAWSNAINANPAAMDILQRDHPREAERIIFHEQFKNDIAGMLAMLPGLQGLVQRWQAAQGRPGVTAAPVQIDTRIPAEVLASQAAETPAQTTAAGQAVQTELKRVQEVLPEGVNRPIRGVRSLPGRLLDYGLRTVLFVTDGRGTGNLNLRLPVRSLAAVVLAGLALLQTVVAVFAGVRADARAVDDLSPRFEAIKRTLVLPDRITAREYNVKQIRFRPLSELGGFWQRLLRGQLLGAYQENYQAADHGEWASIFVPDSLLRKMADPMPAADGTLRTALARLGYRTQAMLFGAIAGYQAEQYYQASRWDGVAQTFGLPSLAAPAEAEAPAVDNLLAGELTAAWHQATRQKVGVTAMELTGLVDEYLREAASAQNLAADQSLQALKDALVQELEQGAEPSLATVMRIASQLQGVAPGSLAAVLRELTREGQQLEASRRQLVANGVVSRLIAGEQAISANAAARRVETVAAVAGQEVYVQSMPAANQAQLAAVQQALAGLRGRRGVEGLVSRLELAERVLTAIRGTATGTLGLMEQADGLALRGELARQARAEQAEVFTIGEDLSRNIIGVKTGRVTTLQLQGVDLANPQVYEVSAPVKQALEAADVLKTELPENVVARAYTGEIEQMTAVPRPRLTVLTRLMHLIPSRRMQMLAMQADPMGYWQSVVGGLGLSETAFGALLQRGDSPIVQAYLRYAARPESRKAERDLMKAMLRALKAEGEKAQTA